MTIKIDNHIPPPKKRSGGARPPIYPFAAMKVGDSFALPAEMAMKLGSAATKWRSRHEGWDYRTARANGEIRLWRIK